jgi:hypothetical protein
MPLFKHITLALAALAALGFALPPPAGAQSTQIRRFVGIYSATRQGADSARQLLKLELELDPGGRAVLTTTYPGYTKSAAGAPVYPQIEKGTWSVANQYAIVHFTRRANVTGNETHDTYKPEDIALTFSLGFRCTLKLERDDANLFGKDGLKMQGHGC